MPAHARHRSCRTSLRQRREASCAGGSREPSCCAADEQPPKEEPGAHGAAAATAAAAQQANSSSAAWVKPELPGSLQSAGDGPCPPPAANEPVWVKPEPLVYGGGYDDVLACSGLSSCAAAMEAACEPFGGGLLLFDAAPMHAGSLSPVPAPALPQPCGTPAACAPACGGFTADSAAAELADAFCGASSSLSEELEAAAEAAYGDVARSLSAAFVGHDTADSADCNDSLYESLLQQLLADIQAPPVAAQHGSAALAAGGMPLHSHGLLAPAAAPEPAPQPVSHRRLQHLQQCFGQLQQMLCFGTMCCSQLLSNLAGPASF